MGPINPILKYFICITVLGLSTSAHGMQLYSPVLETKPGQRIVVPLMIDRVDNLAGVKMVLTYDPLLLTYAGSAKTELSSSLMHIVNDKKPGVLIVVMAGARGIKGEVFSLFDLYFTIADQIKEPVETQICSTQIQVMGDDLKDVGCTFAPIQIKIGH